MRLGLSAAVVLAVALWGAGIVPVCRAAEGAAAVSEKNAEVERLRRSLEQAEKELQQLKADNARLRQAREKEARQPEAKRSEQEMQKLREENERLRGAQERAARNPAPPAREAKPVRPLAGLPPLGADSVVDADELVGHFAAEPAAAAAYYGRKTFRVRGVVDRFDAGFVTRRFTVLLASPDPAYTVPCRFNYVDRYKAVFTTRSGRTLTARQENGGEVALLEAGQTVVIRGRCAQADEDGEIRFTQCELVP